MAAVHHRQDTRVKDQDQYEFSLQCCHQWNHGGMSNYDDDYDDTRDDIQG